MKFSTVKRRDINFAFFFIQKKPTHITHNMETWRLRIMVAAALCILVFGDFLGAVKDRKVPASRHAYTLHDSQPSIYLDNTNNDNGELVVFFVGDGYDWAIHDRL